MKNKYLERERNRARGLRTGYDQYGYAGSNRDSFEERHGGHFGDIDHEKDYGRFAAERNRNYDPYDSYDSRREIIQRRYDERNSPWHRDRYREEAGYDPDYDYNSGYRNERYPVRRSYDDYDHRPSRSGYGTDYNYDGAGYYRNRERGVDYDASGSRRDWWDRASDEVASWFGDEDAERRRKLDRIQGEHRGKGPKGYQRSDDRIREEVNDRLSDDSYIDASDIEVKVEKGLVILSGTVEDRSSKIRAERLVERVSGIHNVENHLHIARPMDRDLYRSQIEGRQAASDRNK